MFIINDHVTGFSFNVDKDKLVSLFLSKGDKATMNDLMDEFFITVEGVKTETVCKFIFKLKEHFIIDNGTVVFIDESFNENLNSSTDKYFVINDKGNRLLLITHDTQFKIIQPMDALISKLLEEWFAISGDISIIREYCKDSKTRTYRFRKIIK